MIASGPAYPDSSTCAQAKEIVQKYHLPMTEQMLTLLEQETAQSAGQRRNPDHRQRAPAVRRRRCHRPHPWL